VTPAAPATPVFPPGRYGRRRDPVRQRRRRWVTFVLAGLVIAAGVAAAVKLYRQYSTPLYEVTIIQVTDLSDQAVTVTFDVRTPPGQGATCTVRAHTREGERVGEATIEVPPGTPGQNTSRVTYTLVTTKRPMTGEVPGCGP
jgi:Domain of unknown function (DUF4307)